jgi:hypothetical protein
MQPHMDSNTLATWIGSIGTITGVILAGWGIYLQLKKQWLLNSANTVTTLAETWGNESWRKFRKHSATSLKTKLNGGNINLSKDLPVLGFFENLGHLVRRGAFDKEMIWNKFGWYIVRYYIATCYKEDLIQEIRAKENDITLWEEFQWLTSEMLVIYQKRGVLIIDENKKAETIDCRINELFEQETNLDII